jgi:hypothetical protein
LAKEILRSAAFSALLHYDHKLTHARLVWLALYGSEATRPRHSGDSPGPEFERMIEAARRGPRSSMSSWSIPSAASSTTTSTWNSTSERARQGPTACGGMAVPMQKLDTLVAQHLRNGCCNPTGWRPPSSGPHRQPQGDPRSGPLPQVPRAGHAGPRSGNQAVTPQMLTRFAQTAATECACPAAASAATTCAPSPNASRWRKARSGSSDRSPGCSRRSQRTAAETQCPLRD